MGSTGPGGGQRRDRAAGPGCDRLPPPRHPLGQHGLQDGPRESRPDAPRRSIRRALDGDFEAEVVSAFGEAFNNIAVHGFDAAPRPSRCGSRSTGTTRSSSSPASTWATPSIPARSRRPIWTSSPSTAWGSSSCGAAWTRSTTARARPTCCAWSSSAPRRGQAPAASGGASPGEIEVSPAAAGYDLRRLRPEPSAPSSPRPTLRGVEPTAVPGRPGGCGWRRGRGDDEIQANGRRRRDDPGDRRHARRRDGAGAPHRRGSARQREAAGGHPRAQGPAADRQLRRGRDRLALQADPPERRAGQDRRAPRPAPRHFPSAASGSRLPQRGAGSLGGTPRVSEFGRQGRCSGQGRWRALLAGSVAFWG